MQSSDKPIYNRRGDRLSAKRELKRRIKAKYNITTGRQFRKLRKRLNREQKNVAV